MSTLTNAAHTAHWAAGQVRWSVGRYGHAGPELMNDLIEAVVYLAGVNDRTARSERTPPREGAEERSPGTDQPGSPTRGSHPGWPCEGRAMTTLEPRIAALEATAYRSAGEFAEIRQAVAHLTSAIGELSQGQRGIGQDVREIAQSLDLVESHISEQATMLREQGQMLRAIVVHLGLNPG